METYESRFNTEMKQDEYHNDPKLLDSVEPDQTAPDQGLHCLPFHLHLLDQNDTAPILE